MVDSISTTNKNAAVDPYKAHNYEDLPLDQKINDLVTFVQGIKYGMLTTKLSGDSDLLASRCMALAGQENGGIDLLFHTNIFSGKAMDLTVHPTETNMSFLDPISGAWASISGTASIIGDPKVVEKYYTPVLKTWLGDMGDGVHDGGPADPRIGVIKLEAKLATYTLARKGIVGRAVDEVRGVVKGEVPAINKIREVSQSELAEWRQTHKQTN